MDENNKNIDNNMNFGGNNENTDNPYYNPYFQNNDLNSSPYFSDSDVNLNNNLYTDPTSAPSNATKPDNQNNIENNDGNLNNNNNEDANSINLFDLADDNSQNTTQNVTNPNTPSQPHINPILSNTTFYNDDNSYGQPTSNGVNNNEPVNNQNYSDNNIQQPNTSFNNGFSQQDESFNNNFSQQQNTSFNNDFSQQDESFNNNFSQQQNTSFNNNFSQPDGTFNSGFSQMNSPFDDNLSQANTSFNNYQEVNDQSTDFYGSDNDEAFRKAWMGNLYDKANTKKFNWSAFFFGGMYFFYRKLYLFGILFAILSVLPIINNIICGFAFYPLYKSHINKQLAKNKNNVQSPSQLLDIANKKGGTSIPSVLIALLISGTVSGIFFIVVFSQLIDSILGIFDLPSSGGSSLPTPSSPDTSINTPQEPVSTYDYYNFYNDYEIEYDSSSWQMNTEGTGLVNGNYGFSYIQSIENLSTIGYDVSTNEGRSSFFTFLYNQFSSQTDASTTLELGSSNFNSLGNNIYMASLDLIYATNNIERCYFVLLPEDDIFIEFILSNQDTVIAEEINTEIGGYISNISKVSERNDNENQSSNTNLNNVDDQSIQDMLDNMSDTLNTQAVQAHNTTFSNYFGNNLSGSNCRALIAQINANNRTAISNNSIDEFIYLIINDATGNTVYASTTSDTEVSVDLIQSTSSYTVALGGDGSSSDDQNNTASYWSNGFIKTIIITANA